METREILQDIIGGFSPDKFTRFFREKNRSFAPRQESFTHYNDEYFFDGIKLGEIKFSESEKVVVCAFKANQPLSERSSKKAQYEKGKKILKDTQSDAGIFIFYDKDDNFRFSLIYPKAIGNRRQWSNFRRFTYFVSREFTNKTFLQRIGDGDFSSLEKIKDAFSVEKVTKEFYEDIANWYFWAVQHSTFPKDAEVEENGRNIAVIRLITRMIFIWFMREKSLVPKNLFEEESILAMLKEISPESSTYYQAILQNLFFATLSTKKDDRKFRSEIRGYKGYNPDFGNQNVFRFQELFKNPENLKDDFGEIPFLNGGLFECLDDKPNGIYIDGFTSVKKNQPTVPNILFFSGEQKADLNSAYGTKNKTYKVRGLIDILSSFNFTIDENSPDDQDIALDPELLGRVFENLLASFNPETSTTARKATGSYYTPREIVDYMVTESLKAYFKTHLSAISDLDKKIAQLFLTGSEENLFDKSESKKIVELIESVRIVDPAVGSGAFPMGALNKLVFILNKVDPGNELWKQAQLSAADTIPDPRIKQDTKNRIEEFFTGKNADYGRKLYLIQKCIYGVDIQQIAVEIAKLRFFISLLVDEKIDKTKDNWGIEPLPNLDFKIMQGNSLISEFLGIDFDNGQEKQDLQGQVGFGFENKDDSLIKEFERKKIDYQNESDKDKKTVLKNEVEDLMIKIFEDKLQKKYSELRPIEEKAQRILNLKAREDYIKTEKEKFSKKHGFNLENIEKQLREFTSKKKTRPFFPWKLYFAEVFFEKGGFDIVIANPPYGADIDNVQKDILKKKYDHITERIRNSFLYFIGFGYEIARDDGIVCYILPNEFLFQIYMTKARAFFIEKSQVLFAVNVGEDVFEAVVPTCIFAFKKKIISSYDIPVADLRHSSLEDLQHKLNTNLFLQLPNSTILQSPNSIFSFDINKTTLVNKLASKFSKFGLYCQDVANGISTSYDAVYMVTEKTAEENKFEKEYLKPSIKGGQFNRYFCPDKTGEFVLYICDDFNSKSAKNIYKYLIENKNMLIKKCVEKRSGTRNWHVLFRSRYKELFVPPKILIRQTGDSVIAAADNNIGFYCIDSVNIALLKSEYLKQIKYFVALLNSSLINFYYKEISQEEGRVLAQVKPQRIRTLPINFGTLNQQKSIMIIVDKILTITKPASPAGRSSDYLENPAKKAEVKEYEKQIDQMVYKLYGLTEEEIKIVEGNER